MLLKEGSNIGYRIPMITVSLLLLVVVWESSPSFFLSNPRAYASQLQTFFRSQPTHEVIPLANTSSDSTPGNDVDQHASGPAVVPLVHTDSPGAEEESSKLQEPKKRPVKTVEPDSQLQSESRVNTTNYTTNPVNSTLDEFSDDAQLVPFNTAAVSESDTSSPIYDTSDVVFEDDTQVVAEPIVQDDPQQAPGEKYIIPLLSYQVGTGNQLMEYKSAATIARTLNRTLCLIPFWDGPGYLGGRHSALIMEDRYDIEVLSKYTKVASMDECVKKCESRLDVHWRLRNSRRPRWEKWFNDTPKFSLDFTKQFNHWSSTADLEAAMGPRNDDGKCVGLGGLFPGLRWKGVMYAGSTYMQHSKLIMKATDIFQKRALGSNDHNYISIHWRFEESFCRGHPLGLCFSRCSDGAVIANGRPSETWHTMTLDDVKQFTKPGFNGVLVNQSDVSGAIVDRAAEHGVSNVYLSTDGWLRGAVSAGILKWVVEDVRSKGLNIAGLWMVHGLPNFGDGYYVHSQNIAELFGLDPKEVVSNHMISLVEQEVSLRSLVFLGSGSSTFSKAIASTRRGRQCKQELDELITGFNLGTPPEVVEQAVIDRILSIKYSIGTVCKGNFNITTHKWDDEAPDGWLDYDACERQMLKGVYTDDPLQSLIHTVLRNSFRRRPGILVLAKIDRNLSFTGKHVLHVLEFFRLTLPDEFDFNLE